MVSEEICLRIVTALHGQTVTYTERDGQGNITQNPVNNASPEADLYRPLLVLYALAEIDSAVRWLQLGGYLGRTQWGALGLWVYTLSEKGIALARQQGFSDDERKLLYQVNPYQVFVAHQFREADITLVKHFRAQVLEPAGFHVVGGQADGLEEFRSAIMRKIRDSRFFVCILTHRVRLESGAFVSSVWLYQEIGAAIAAGKTPLLLIEQDMDSHFEGELQRTYEHIPFSRSDPQPALDMALRRLLSDLDAHHIPRSRP